MKSNTTMEKDLDNYYKQIAKALPAGGRKALRLITMCGNECN